LDDGKQCLDALQAVREITECLQESTHSNLRELTLSLGDGFDPSFRTSFDTSDCLDSMKLLCNVSTIESIYNSNHMLQKIDVQGHELSAFATKCLELNENEDKAQVVRHKILRFYFTGQYDVSPFVSMPLSVLPEVISQIKGKKKKRMSAIYRLLRCIPELCNISARESTHQSGNERQKIGM
jgi:hypothetical protein